MGSKKRARWGVMLGAAGLLFFGLAKVTAFSEKEVVKPGGASADTNAAASADGKPQGKVVAKGLQVRRL